MMLAVVRAAVENGAAKDFFAVLIAVIGGFSVLAYAAASDLFDLKLFKFDPLAFRLPKETRVEFWYTRAAKRLESFLAGGGWRYAKAKKQAKVTVKRDWRRLRKETRRVLPEAVSRLNRDIALGALAIAIALVALLLTSLL
jgi:hypothetical protein